MDRQASTTPVPDKERVVIEIPELIVDYYLLWITFPRRPRHIGTLVLHKKQAYAKDLWGLSQDEDQQARLTIASASEAKSREIQKLHKNKIPSLEVLKNASPQEGLEAPTPLLAVPCMNFDLHPEGKSVDPKDPHDRYDITNGSLFKIPTFNHAVYLYSEEPAYGLFPRLCMVEAKKGNPDNKARVHCGREWRHTHQTSNLSKGHLIIDQDGQWTDLTGTFGCIRLSLLAMRELFEALKPISTMSFDWQEKKAAPGRTPLPYAQASAGTRKASSKKPDKPEAVGFIYAEEHPDADWCYYAGMRIDTGAPGETPPLFSDMLEACGSAKWTSQDFIKFHKKVSSVSVAFDD